MASSQDPRQDEGAFAARVNSERASRGLSRLPAASDLITVARRHAAEMARRGTIGHYGDLRAEVSNWQEVGENVGAGPTVDDVHRAFMASPSHRDEILRPGYQDLGVGVVWAGGRLWVSEIFRRRLGTAPAPSPAPGPSEPARHTAAAGPARASRSSSRQRTAPAPATSPRATAYLEAMAAADREQVAAYWRALADAERAATAPAAEAAETDAPADAPSPPESDAGQRLAAAEGTVDDPSPASRVAGAVVIAAAGLVGLGMRRRARR